MNLESIDSGLIILRRFLRDQVGMGHEVQMWEGRTKVGSINIGLSCRFGKEESMTSWTEYIDGVVAG